MVVSWIRRLPERSVSANSLSNWLVNKAKENPKTVQGILGHSRIQTTLDLYTDEDLDEMIAAQEKFLDAVGFDAGSVQ
jgi:integrase